MTRERVSGATFDEVVDIARQIEMARSQELGEREAKRPRRPGMDWLSPCHAILDCHTKIVMLAMPRLPKVEWRGSLDYVPSRLVFYLKAQRMGGKGCLSYLAFVGDVDADTPIIDSVPVVRDFPEVFPADLLGMPPDRDIDFGIDLVAGTLPISLPLYRMALAKLKELKEQLQELLDKPLRTFRSFG
ncbi:uncharacterized protein [Nicotiana tomentosiformis]|uniref:uncharacterized protein n=1 Tax=Nicotiana tomentosiformis TaxID=4098 RepID=UPI00388CE217